MSKVTITCPSGSPSSSGAPEATIEWLTDALNIDDAPATDRESDKCTEGSNDAEGEMWPEWRSNVEHNEVIQAQRSNADKTRNDPNGYAGGREQLVLSALIRMAQRSARFQADFAAALRGSGIVLSELETNKMLAGLSEAGFVRAIIPLMDGGRLVTITAKGVEAWDCLRA